MVMGEINLNLPPMKNGIPIVPEDKKSKQIGCYILGKGNELCLRDCSQFSQIKVFISLNEKMFLLKSLWKIIVSFWTSSYISLLRQEIGRRHIRKS